MQYDRKLRISAAGSRKAKRWPACEMMWSEFVKKLETPTRGAESYNDYISYQKGVQAELKDVGGFVGGTFQGERRKSGHSLGRDLLTLDLDTIPAGETEDILKRVGGLGCAAVVYSTRKHASYAPRLRVVVPFDRTAAPDEYEPAARKVAELIGMEFHDPTTFDICRLMYWPSCCADGEYVFQAFDRPFCNVDGILGMYQDWHNVDEWPQAPGEEALRKREQAKQEDPETKRGLVGAFCRAYTVPEAINTFLAGLYEETNTPGRYTYTGGSTAGGAVLYDNGKFLYSHHATDPCSNQLVNAFDLVRLHKFGELDLEAKDQTPAGRMPSFTAMSDLARRDERTAHLMAAERIQKAKETFGGAMQGNNPAVNPALPVVPAPQPSNVVRMPEPAADDLAWTSQLETDARGEITKTIGNAKLVLELDPELRGKVAMDEFANCGAALGPLPWNRSEGRRRWTEEDDAGFYWYLEGAYRITGREKLDTALLLVSANNRVNEVRDYLNSLVWDGVPRVETLLPDYLGAEDNEYTRAVMRKSLAAAVGRATVGGIKYDCMPILTGPQGIGKSTFLAILGGDWFSDSLTTFEGKEAAEMIQGTWINEIGELTALSRQETNAVKQFLSKTDDIYRAAYGKRVNKYPRRCVFFGTSNDTEFLRDTTGNRRFWPVDVGEYDARKSVWDDLPKERDQIWAEAKVLWDGGEPLYMKGELLEMAKEAQDEHRLASEKEGAIRKYLDTPIPLNWDDMSKMDRILYLQGSLKAAGPTRYRDKVCAVEIWCECFGGDLKYLKSADSREINAIVAQTPGWKRNKSGRRYGPYGTQRGFERKLKGVNIDVNTPEYR